MEGIEEPRSGCCRATSARWLTRSRPAIAQTVYRGRCATGMDAASRRRSTYLAQQPANLRGRGFRQERGTQVRRSDGVGVFNHHLLADVESIGRHREGEAERESEKTERRPYWARRALGSPPEAWRRFPIHSPTSMATRPAR